MPEHSDSVPVARPDALIHTDDLDFDPDAQEVVGPAEEHVFPPDLPPIDDQDRIYHPQPGEHQLTLRALLTGCLIGAVVSAMNISIGLQIGWTFGGSIIAAILGYSFFKTVLRPRDPFTVLETNIAQTAGSATGYMASSAGLVSSIPALLLLKKDGVIDLELGYLQLTLWALAIGFLGVFFAVPLRNQMVVIEKLRFPSGTATAQTIVSIFAEGAEAVRKARVLLYFALIAGAFVLLKYDWSNLIGADWIAWWPGGDLQKPPIEWIGPLGVFLTAWGFIIYLSPVMTGAGLLIGPRVGASLLAGADHRLVHSRVLRGLPERLDHRRTPARRRVESQGSLRIRLRHPRLDPLARRGHHGGRRPDLSGPVVEDHHPVPSSPARAATTSGSNRPEQRIPNIVWMGGLACGTILVSTVAYSVFGIPVWMSLIAVAISWILAAIAVRSTGETDINPTGGMGKVTQLVFGGIAPGNISTNLLAAGISSAGASQAGDMMHDLKTGRMLGAAPRKQIVAQCCGILAGILVVVPMFLLFDKVHEIGGDESDYPAPAALAWKAMAEILADGFGALPKYAEYAVLCGALFGMIIPILRKTIKPLAPYMPSGLAFGIAFIVHAYFSIAMFVGSMLLVVWKAKWPASHKALVFAVASGLLAGEGVMNVVTALMDLAKQMLG
jgi:uncharacterized oligopeptide transporter (OPT) family protein